MKKEDVMESMWRSSGETPMLSRLAAYQSGKNEPRLRLRCGTEAMARMHSRLHQGEENGNRDEVNQDGGGQACPPGILSRTREAKEGWSSRCG